MEISSQHVEYAVVQRLSRLLEVPNSEFSVTNAYALFVTTLCWVMQRIRTTGCTHQDQRAKEMFQQLQRETVEDWGIRTQKDVVPFHGTVPIVGPFPNFRDRRADKFMIDLRNAVAHGDARKIEPYHLRQQGSPVVQLIGFSFDCVEVDQSKESCGGVKLH